MGTINSIYCKNCNYHKKIYEGFGMIRFAEIRGLEKDILEGKINNPKAIEYLSQGCHFDCEAAYLCPTCKEIVNHSAIFMKINCVISPYGTERYDIVFPFEMPLCENCGTKLHFIKNIRSSNVKCPKCNGDLNAKLCGYVD